MTNIYEQILANIDADKKAWCQGEWCVTDDKGKPVSRCLVEHIDLAVGTTYIKPDGKVFVSKDVKKWNRRERVLANLLSLVPQSWREERGYDEVEVMTYRDKSKLLEDIRRDDDYRRPGSEVASALVEFNDTGTTTKAAVKKLLKQAAKQFPGA